MRNLYTTTALAALFLGAAPLAVRSQITFANANTKLAGAAFHSGVGISVVDMDGDGMDDIARMDQGHRLQIEKQRVGQPFLTVPGTDMGGGSAWSMVVGDVNGDGYRDVVAGFNGNATLSKANAGGASYASATTLINSTFFLQNMNMMDVDNDGDLDILGCNDNGMSKIWVNNGSGSYSLSNIINFDVSTTDDSGNYGSIWSDFDNDGDVDLFIAKCRQGVNNINDERRISILFVNNGNGTYTENGAAYGLRIKAQSWTASFEDINNDGWFDVLLTQHDVNTKLMLNDGTGHFTDINANNGAGLNINFTPYQSKMADFDNDGWVDVLISGSAGNPGSGRLFRNNHNNTFTAVTTAFPSTGDNALQSYAVGDLNHDGKLDLYAGYADGYTTPSNTDDVLWLNSSSNSNHFVSYTLRGTVSNRDALGARIFIYGAWGVQTREVRAGESYGTCNSFNLHFGLGTATAIDSTVIRWPSGTVTRIANQAVDRFVTVVEGECVLADNRITTVGSPVLCAGQTVTLSAPTGTGYSYLWSNGATSATTQVSAAGEYSVKVTAGNCTSVSPIIRVEVSPDETPTISAAGDLSFCHGGSVMLQGPPGLSGYQWTGGATTQNLEVTESGSYSLTIQGACQQWTSAPIAVDVLANVPPTVQGDSIPNSGTGTLHATGDNVEWFTDNTGSNAIATGNTYVTPTLTQTTTYYVQNTTIYAGQTDNTGQTNHAGTSQYSGGNTTNASMMFDVLDDCVLKSVKVYTDVAGNRLIQVKDGNGNVVASATVNIPVTTSLPGGSTRITLDFNLTPGSYTIGTDGATNTASLGYATPRLRRTNGTGVSYPYSIPNVLSITSSSEGSALYYYFYDWEVESGTETCVSTRVPVTAVVYQNNAGIASWNETAGLTVYPNPTEGFLNIKAKSDLNGATLKVLDVTGKTVRLERTVNLLQDAVKTIDLTGLASGLYTLELANGEKVYNSKFVIR